ncbi:MAG: NADH-quinone oxidoreductase subunit H [Bdellovibrionaceae bacterium]|nr:NADH-quinone oxidoreductase subunit H [Pseudobdellovibrionaceae bacterium]
MGTDIFEFSINFIKICIIFISMIALVPLLVWAERRVSALMQNRLGPNRYGPFGLMQILADLVKPLMKENFVKGNRKFFYYLAPILAVIPPAVVFGSIPFSAPFEIPAFEFFGFNLGPYTFYFQSFHLNSAVVFALGVSSLASYALLVAGWSSESKYPLLGALRAAAQNISYELALSLSLVGILLVFNSLDFLEIIKKQSGPLSFSLFEKDFVFSFLPNWGLFYQPLGALIFFISLLAECNRIPFDLPEAEAELVAGYHTEYGGIKLILFYIGEYAHMMVSSALMIVFYFGGFDPYPFSQESLLNFAGSDFMLSLLLLFVFIIKFFLFLFIFMWIRWSLPRFRYDQLMDLGWKKLLPWALFNAVITGFFIFL